MVPLRLHCCGMAVVEVGENGSCLFFGFPSAARASVSENSLEVTVNKKVENELTGVHAISFTPNGLGVEFVEKKKKRKDRVNRTKRKLAFFLLCVNNTLCYNCQHPNTTYTIRIDHKRSG
jgi:hypothetical protein